MIVLLSCSHDADNVIIENLQDYIDANSDRVLDEVIACAGSEQTNTDVTYVFYYPIEGAVGIRYYETDNISANSNNFSQYTRIMLPNEAVFGGKLERFIRNRNTESWCIVTYLSEGKFHKSNPIRLKNKSKPTEWKTEVAIDYTEPLQPKFLWNDGMIAENTIYFQVISDTNNYFLSGTYTIVKEFQYNSTTNVVLDINTSMPIPLVLHEKYNFTLMGVSEDNWVNLVIQKSFIAK